MIPHFVFAPQKNSANINSYLLTCPTFATWAGFVVSLDVYHLSCALACHGGLGWFFPCLLVFHWWLCVLWIPWTCWASQVSSLLGLWAPQSLKFGALQALLSIVNLPPWRGSHHDLSHHDLHVFIVILPMAVVISPGHCDLACHPCLAVVFSPFVLIWLSWSCLAVVISGHCDLHVSVMISGHHDLRQSNSGWQGCCFGKFHVVNVASINILYSLSMYSQF